MAACTGGEPSPPVSIPPPPSSPDPTPPDPSPPDPTPGDPFAGGVIATFRDQGVGPDGQPFDETFRVWITNPQTIDDLFQIEAGINPNRFPSGRFLAGPGQGDHNLPWSWHLDPDDIQMVEVSFEVCDGRPSIVETMVAEFVALGRYCPWDADLDSIEDHR